MLIKIDNLGDLPVLNSYFNFAEYDADEIEFLDREKVLLLKMTSGIDHRKRLRYNLLFLKSYIVPVYRCFLRIYGVNSCEINDAAGVGNYDLYGIECNDSENIVTISTNNAVDIRAKVNKLEISLEITEQCVGENTSINLLGTE